MFVLVVYWGVGGVGVRGGGGFGGLGFRLFGCLGFWGFGEFNLWELEVARLALVPEISASVV